MARAPDPPESARSLGSLSTISSSSDECAAAETTNRRVITIWVQPPIVLYEYATAVEVIDEIKEGVTRFEERGDQTEEEEREMKDEETQTSGGRRKTMSIQADVWLLCSPCEYEDSASERMLKHISAELHKDELREWIGEVPSRNVSFSIRPLSQETRTTLRVAAYNEDHKTFVLLVCVKGQMMVELRSLTNLLSSQSTPIPEINGEGPFLLTTCSSLIAYACNRTFAIRTFFDFNNYSVHSFNHRITALFCTPDQEVMILLENGEVHRYREKTMSTDRLFIITPLHPTAFFADHLLSRIYIVCPKAVLSIPLAAPLDYESYDRLELLDTDVVREVDIDYFIVFSKKRQRAWVCREDDPRIISWTFEFPSQEYTVDMAAAGGVLYSITVDGVITKWELRKEGRKRRSAVYRTGMDHATRLLQIFDKKFAVSSTKMLEFFVFQE